MSCASANCRGLGNFPAVRELRSFVKQYDPALLFVMETKIKGKRVEKLSRTFALLEDFAVDSDGLSGGIGLFWLLSRLT
jgi:predicted metal-binding protein